jgi:hypothetical protein
MGAGTLSPAGIQFPASPALSELLYRLSYRGTPCILAAFKNLLAAGSFRITTTLPFKDWACKKHKV